MNQKKFTTLITTLPLTILLIVIILCSIVGAIHSRMQAVGNDLWPGYVDVSSDPKRPTCDAETLVAPTETAPAAVEGADDSFIDDLFGEETNTVSPEAVAAAKAECDAKLAKYESIVERRKSTSLRVFSSIEQAIGQFTLRTPDFKPRFLILVFLFCSLAATLNRQHIGLRTPTTKRGDRASQILQLIGNLSVLVSFLFYYSIDSNSFLWIFVFGFMALANLWLIAHPLPDPAPDENNPTPKTSLTQILLGIPLYAYMAIICTIYFIGIELHPIGVAEFLHKMTENAEPYTNVALYVFCGMMLKNTTIANKFLSIIKPWKLSPELLVFFIVVLSAVPTAYSGASGIFVMAAGGIIYNEFKKAGVRDSLALAGTAMSGSMGIVLSPCLLVVIIAALNKQITSDELYSAGLDVFFINIFIFACVLLFTRKEKLHCENPFRAFPEMLKKCISVLPHIAIGALVIAFFRFFLKTEFNSNTVPYILPFMLLCMLIYDRISEKRRYLKKLAMQDNAASQNADSSNTPTVTEPAPQNESDSKTATASDESASSKDAAPQSDAPDTAAACAKEASKTTDSSANADTQPEPPHGIGHALLASADATANASGALLSLMGMSVCLGGILELANVSKLFPEKFSSKYAAMGFLVVILVAIGMIMDPYGAVILVTATMTQLVEANGLNFKQFWLVVLCAFELGYLTPPVALNQLLTRQVVGEKGYQYESSLENRAKNFWYRHERLLLPIAVKGVVLLLVAFLPLVINVFR